MKSGDFRISNRGRKQIYTGSVWARVCDHPGCKSYARLGGYCRNHYNAPNHGFFKKNDTRVNNKGIKQRFNGKEWERICNAEDCKNLSIKNGVCYTHKLE